MAETNGRAKRVLARICGVATALALVLAPGPAVHGQSTPPSGGTGGSTHRSGSGAESTRVSDAATRAIVRDLGAVRQECGRYDPVYRIDCLRQGLRDVAGRMPRGEYGKARQIVLEASSKLASIQARNVDASARKQASAPNPRFKRKRTYSAVQRSNLAQAMQQAERVIVEAETKLLRSEENSEKRYSHYQQIAAAVGSNKVLMRSA